MAIPEKTTVRSDVNRDVALRIERMPTYVDELGRRRCLCYSHVQLCRELVRSGASVRTAARRVGLGASSAYMALEEPHVRAYLDKLLVEELGLCGTEAFHTLNGLLDSDSASTRLKAARVILDRSRQCSALPRAKSRIAIKLSVNPASS